MRNLAVLFPGIGYTMDRPLLHFSRRLAAGRGYEIKPIFYTGFPSNVRGDRGKMLRCYEIARAQAEEALSGVDLAAYDDILFVSKSVGTAVAAALAAESPAGDRIRQILYTPLEDTFSVPIRDAVVFTGGNDPWAGGAASPIPALCAQRGLPCHRIPGADHSLETDDVERDLQNLRRIMGETDRYIRGMTVREAEEGDLPAMAALHVANQRATYRGLLSDGYLDRLDPAEQAERWEAFARQAGQRLFVARDRTGLLGFAACRREAERPDCLYLASLHVAPEARGQGVGTDLIRRAGRYARELGCHGMSVCIVKGNDGARRLYTGLGAVHEKDFTDEFDGTTSHSEKLRWPDLRFADREDPFGPEASCAGPGECDIL